MGNIKKNIDLFKESGIFCTLYMKKNGSCSNIFWAMVQSVCVQVLYAAFPSVSVFARPGPLNGRWVTQRYGRVQKNENIIRKKHNIQ